MTELLRQHKRPKRGSICGGGAAVASVVMAEGRAGASEGEGGCWPLILWVLVGDAADDA